MNAALSEFSCPRSPKRSHSRPSGSVSKAGAGLLGPDVEQSPPLWKTQGLDGIHFSDGLTAAHSYGKHQSLAMQTGKLKRNPEAFVAPNIEGDNFILGDAIKIPIGTKAKTARPAKSLRSFGRKMRTRCPSAERTR
jgi:hypothetical protein